MSENVMLILIGGRSALPAIVGGLHFINEIDRVKFLVCKGDAYSKFQQGAEKVLKQAKINLTCDESDVEVVEPNDFDQVYEAVNKLCNSVERVGFVNLTTVPQTMAIAVYGYITEKYADSSLVFSVNTDKSQIIPLARNQRPITLAKKLIDVEKYVAMYGLNIFRKGLPNENPDIDRLIEAATYFFDDLDTTDKVLTIIRSKAGGGDTARVPKTFSISPNREMNIELIYSFLEQLQQFSLIRNLNKVSENEISYRIETQEDYKFLVGDWLEVLVYNFAKKCEFDAVEIGVELDNFRGEIDVFCVHKANAIICECKTGKFDANDLSTLDSKAQRVGDNYCIKIFVTNRDSSEEFKNQATNKKIVVVDKNNLKDIEKILKSESDNPTYKRR